MFIFVSILAVILSGLIIGNIATTFFYRLPRGVMLQGFNKNNTKPPCCSKCLHPLKYYEYLPVLSWWSTFGNCNYCGQSINKKYTFIEMIITLISLRCFYLYQDNLDFYFIVLCFSVVCIIAICIDIEHYKIMNILTISMINTGLIYRTLSDEAILPAIFDISIISVILLSLMSHDKLYKIIEDNGRYSLIHIFLPASLWCDKNVIVYYCIIVAMFYIIDKLLYKKFNSYCSSILLLLGISIY